MLLKAVLQIPKKVPRVAVFEALEEISSQKKTHIIARLLEGKKFQVSLIMYEFSFPLQESVISSFAITAELLFAYL